MKKILLFFVLLTLLQSCSDDFFYKTIDIKVDEYPEGLALTGLWPDSDHGGKIAISEAKAILTNEPQFISDADISISSNPPNQWKIRYNAQYSAYDCIPDQPIKIGEEIIIKVKHKNLPTIESRQVKPDSVSIASVDYIREGYTTTDGFKEDVFKINFQDPPVKNYYAIAIKTLTVFNDYFLSYLESNEAFDVVNYNDLVLFDDRLFNGKNFTVNLHTSQSLNTGDKIEYYLINLTEDYYKNAVSSALVEEIGDNPFTEPVIIHQNVKSGYGIFGLGTLTKKIKQL